MPSLRQDAINGEDGPRLNHQTALSQVAMRIGRQLPRIIGCPRRPVPAPQATRWRRCRFRVGHRNPPQAGLTGSAHLSHDVIITLDMIHAYR